MGAGEQTVKRYWQLGVIEIWVLYALLMAYYVLGPPMGLSAPPVMLFVTTLSLFAFSIGHAVWSLGGRQALLFLSLTFGISLVFETVGVLTGWVYGPYYYTSRLGFKVFGLVPLMIPVAWFMMIYPSHVLIERLAGNSRRATLRWTIWLAALSALAMTAWDLVMDPLMVSGGHWVWKVAGAYFGIPVHNYAGWLVTTFCVYLAYRLITAHQSPRPWGPSSPRFASLPVWAYVITWLGFSATAFESGMPGVGLVGFFGMGSLALLGLRPAE
jgi:uncharacterized membrane protein